jgi:hypothetical protein
MVGYAWRTGAVRTEGLDVVGKAAAMVAVVAAA